MVTWILSFAWREFASKPLDFIVPSKLLERMHHSFTWFGIDVNWCMQWQVENVNLVFHSEIWRSILHGP